MARNRGIRRLSFTGKDGTMTRTKMLYSDHFAETMNALTSRGLLLGSYDAEGKPNAMTIGWGSLGSIWGIPAWIVLVRPSRHTYTCIEHTGCFSVNVPGKDLAGACALCGSVSGRDVDKFAEGELTAEKGSAVLAPTIAECPVVYECQVVHSNDVLPQKLADEILSGSYVSGDFHRVYYGKILGAGASEDASTRLA
jgi:flavin reductase (DIM6/NTAB) family NADH-FMN oxidoreductase RutF